ncbi:hypothetical protein FOA43_003269 [Brettanomyces nanus]|uniref:SUN domain-containing protein n=1 Tax=Eeniella nana TaxID=13502 RepID=A0A875S4P0_EENNA|nr:uncharacterized protein FOA43_003269 [Brettanomyces nanus]QPG75883.1 hypothetical protein FOA43_003269 [Brettanomyces nanus]
MSKARSLQSIISYSEKLFDSDPSEEYEYDFERDDHSVPITIDESDTRELNGNLSRGLFVKGLKKDINEHNSDDSASDLDYVPTEADDDDDDDEYSNEKDFEYLNSDGETADLTYESYHPEGFTSHAEEVETETEEIDEIDQLEPPGSVKTRFLLYMLKCAPLVLVVLFLVLLSNVSASFPSQGTDSGYVHHKLYLLEKQLSILRQQQDRLIAGVRENKVVLTNGTEITDYIEQFRSNITSIDDKIRRLQQQDTTITDNDIERIWKILKDKLDDETKEKKPTVTVIRPEIQPKMSSSVSGSSSGLGLDSDSDLDSSPVTYRTQNYGSHGLNNVASTARVLPQLTSMAKVKRVRTKVMDRVLHGFSDFASRKIWKKSSRKPLIGLKGINLGGQDNNPNNVLIEDPRRYWQGLVEDLPLSFTMALREPVCLVEVGISHPRYRYLMSSAPKFVELFVKPSRDLSTIRQQVARYYNQDFRSAVLRSSFAKVGELTYDIGSNQQYQKFTIPKEVKLILMEYPIENVMLVIDSNWGHSNVTVLDTLRLFGLNEVDRKRSFGDRSTGMETVPDLGRDTPMDK